MGYTVWGRERGGPAINRRYQSPLGAEKACKRLNEKVGKTDHYYVKEL